MKLTASKSHFRSAFFAFALAASFEPTVAMARQPAMPAPQDPPKEKAADPQPAPADSALGLWEQQYEYMGVQMVDRYELKKSDSGGFTGVLTREGKEISKLEDIRIDGDKVTFTAKGSENGTDWKVVFKGTVKGDDIDGNVKITVNDQSFETPWKPKRIEKGK